MIPRIIHYAWFGGRPLPADAVRYIDGWRQLLPGYEIRRWDETNFPLDYSKYTREAAKMKNWAFVSDVCRLYALYTFGGIYLDTDIELLKSLDQFLPDKSFIGREATGPCCGVIGAEPQTPWIGQFLDYYNRHHFISTLGHPDRKPNPIILQKEILPRITPDEMPTIYPEPVFYPELVGKGTERHAILMPETVAIHHYAASWRRHRTLGQRIRIIALGLRTRYLSR